MELVPMEADGPGSTGTSHAHWAQAIPAPPKTTLTAAIPTANRTAPMIQPFLNIGEKISEAKFPSLPDFF
jgi:hypothetical protein